MLMPVFHADAQSAAGNLALPGPDAKPFPLAEVHRGLRGTAWTIFEGTVPEPMEVEILGVLKDSIGPGQDMILGRLHGTKPEFTGVVAGMSGSPVYVDGRLVGALSFRIGQFSKEPICGITPIEQMLQVRDAAQATAAITVEHRAELSLGAAEAEMRPIATPLTFSGFSPLALQQFGDGFRRMGLEPTAGLGGSATATSSGSAMKPVVPGEAVSAILARGDLNIAATCTVTYVDARGLLACGHPITQQGELSVPMTRAEVVATLPSPLNAFKIINTTDTIGSFTQDRTGAVAGIFGRTAVMVPVTVELHAPRGSALPSRTIRFEILNNRDLTSQILLTGVFQALSGTTTGSDNLSLRLRGNIEMENAPAITFDEVLASSEQASAAVQGAILIGSRVSQVFANSLELPQLRRITLDADLRQGRSSAQLQSARLSSAEADAGDSILIEATVQPYQQAARIVKIPVRLPSTLTRGSLRILVGDAASLDRLTLAPASATHAASLAETVAELNRNHSNERLYVTLLERQTQGVTAAAALPALPPSITNALTPLRETRDITLTPETAVEAASAPVGDALSGSQVLTLQIR